MAYRPRIVRTAYGSGINSSIHTYLEESGTQTFVIGNFVQIDAGGEVQVVPGGAENHVFGLALENASGTADTEIMCQRLLPGDILSMHLTTAGTDVTPVATTHVGLIYGMVAHGTDTEVHCVDIADTTDPWFRVIGIDGQKSSTNVLVEFMPESVRGDDSPDAAIHV